MACVGGEPVTADYASHHQREFTGATIDRVAVSEPSELDNQPRARGGRDHGPSESAAESLGFPAADASSSACGASSKPDEVDRRRTGDDRTRAMNESEIDGATTAGGACDRCLPAAKEAGRFDLAIYCAVAGTPTPDPRSVAQESKSRRGLFSPVDRLGFRSLARRRTPRSRWACVSFCHGDGLEPWGQTGRPLSAP